MSFHGPNDIDIVEIKERIQSKAKFFWDKENPLSHDFQEPQINFMKHIEKQRAFQIGGEIKKSKQTEIFVHLLQFADSKRYNIPVTQSFGGFNTFGESKMLKQTDIRSMFSKNTNNDITEVPCSLSSAISNFEQEQELFPEELFREITDYLLIQMTEGEDCKTCATMFKCPKFDYNETSSIDMSYWLQPDLTILNSITAKDLQMFAESLNFESKTLCESLEADDDIFDNVCFTQFEELKKDSENEKLEEKSFAYETPKSFGKLLKSFKICQDINDNEEFQNSKQPHEVFATSEVQPREAQNEKEVPTAKNYDDILSFFKLSSFEDLFLDTHDESKDSNETLIYTPEAATIAYNNNSLDIFQKSPDLFPSFEKKIESRPVPEEPESPIICSHESPERVLKAKKKLFNQNESSAGEVAKKPNLSKLKLAHKSFYKSKRTPKKASPPEDRQSNLDLHVAEFCDVAQFGLDKDMLSKAFGLDPLVKNNEEEIVTSEENVMVTSTKPVKELTVEDICDIPSFFSTSPLERSKGQREMESEVKKDTLSDKTEVQDLDDFCDISSFLGCVNENTEKEISDAVKPGTNNILKEQVHVRDEEDFEIPKNKDKITFDEQAKISNDEVDQNLSCFTGSANKSITEEPSAKACSAKKSTDLTDNTTQPVNKAITQLSITQMLSLLSKTQNSAGENNCLKENSTCTTSRPKKTGQKFILSLNNNNTNRKGLRFNNASKERYHQLKQNNSPRTTQKTSSTPKTKSKFNISLSFNSDDEFEDCKTSPIFVKPKSVAVTSSVKKKQLQKPFSSKRKKSRQKLFSEFIEEEAVLSDNDGVAVSDDEGESDDDCFEASFVNDDTQDLLNTTNMQAQYLKTIKSPAVRGRFKIPQRLRLNITNVFSQEVNYEDDTYVNDSFVVNTEDMTSPDRDELSELEVLEKKLKKMKKKKKRKSDETIVINTKRRRIAVIKDDSD